MQNQEKLSFVKMLRKISSLFSTNDFISRQHSEEIFENVFFLKRVRQCDILTSQFKQHGIIEELVDRNIFAETLTTTGFNHEFTGQMCGWLWFQRT